MMEDWTDEALRLSDLFVQVLYKTLSQRVIAELTDARVSVPQVQAMRFIWLHERVLVGDLAEGLSIRYPSATNMVKRLERQQLVERSVNPGDRREVQVKLTPQGQALIEHMEEERVQRLRRVLSGMPAFERQALLRGLHRFVSLTVCDNEEIAHEICLRCGSRASAACPIAQHHTLQICR